MRLNLGITQHGHAVFLRCSDRMIRLFYLRVRTGQKLLCKKHDLDSCERLFVQIEDKEQSILPMFFTPVEEARMKFRYMEFTQSSDLIRTTREEEEPKMICCNSVSKENIASAPFYDMWWFM